MNESQSATVLLLTADLATSSKVSGAAAREGVTLAVALDAVSLTEKAVESRPALVILDLGTPRLVVADVVARMQALAAPPRAIVAFGPHVHEGLLQAARDAGCTAVMSRGQFHTQVDQLLQTANGTRLE